MNFLTKLEKATALKEETVEFEGCSFTIRDMTGVMHDYFKQDSSKRFKYKGSKPIPETYNMEGQAAMIVAMGLVNDETGDLAFDYTDKDDLAKISEMNGQFLSTVSDKILELSGIAAGAKEEAEKKLLPAEQNELGSE